jgi:hypothetical protein
MNWRGYYKSRLSLPKERRYVPPTIERLRRLRGLAA